MKLPFLSFKQDFKDLRLVLPELLLLLFFIAGNKVFESIYLHKPTALGREIPTLCFFLGIGLLFNKFRKIYYLLLFFFLLATFYIQTGHIYLFGTELTVNAMAPVFETTVSESTEFASMYFTPIVLFQMALIFIIPFICWVAIPFKRIATPCWLLLLGVCLILYSTGRTKARYPFPDFYAAEVIHAYNDYKIQSKTFVATIQQLQQENVLPIQSNWNEPQTIVIVIGESSSNLHWSAYGYSRTTTPNLQENPDILFFTDTISPAVHTIAALNKVLFPLTQTQKRLNIVSLFANAGFTSYWISAQPELGSGETFISAIAHTTDHPVFMEKVPTAEVEPWKKNFDEAVIPLFANYLAADTHPKKVFFIHLMGSHASYERRIYEDFAVYEDTPPILQQGAQREEVELATRRINAYDGSILYTDYVLAELIKILNKQAEPTALLYFSDHGEDVFDSGDISGHSSAVMSRSMAEVPFFMVLSANFKQHLLQSETVDFEHARQQPWTTEHLIHLLHQLLQIESPYYEPAKNPLNKAFIVQERYVHDVPYSEMQKVPSQRIP